jgi:hypothetical protein
VDASEASEDAYVQSMVPNPIPTESIPIRHDVSAMAAAFDEDLGFPAAAVMTTTTDTDGSLISINNPLFVRAPPICKRDHTHLEMGLVTPDPISAVQPAKKKAKSDKSAAASETKTPNTTRMSLDDVSAPNPLLVGRAVRLQTEASLQKGASETHKTKSMKVSRKPKSSSTARKISSTSQHPPAPALMKVEPPKLRKPAKFVVPEQISSYPVPSFLIEQMKSTRPPLCKVIVMGKVETTLLGSTDSAIALISAPPQVTTRLGVCCLLPASKNTNQNKMTNAKTKQETEASANASSCRKTTKKAGVHKAKKDGRQKGSSSPVQDPIPSPVSSKVPEVAASDPAPPKFEKLIVANPLENVPPSQSHKVIVPFVASLATAVANDKTDGLATTTEPSPPLTVVSSSSSAATASDIPDELNRPTNATSETADTTHLDTPSSSKPTTKAEKAQACRNRNRQHARNTRLRKKAFVEELKESILDLVEKRDREIDKEKQEEFQKEQRRQTRRKVLSEFLDLRGRNDRNEASWDLLVKDPNSFQLALPVTRFQKMVGQTSSSQSTEDQILVGIKEVMADAAHLASVLQTMGTTHKGKPLVSLEFQTDESPLLMDGSMAILCWKATSNGAVVQVSLLSLLVSPSL